MSDPDGSDGGRGRRRLSRRKLLWGLTTIGAAASAGGGTAAMLTDHERFGSSLTAGTLDLKTAWGNESTAGNDHEVVGDVPSIDLGTAEKGDNGTFTVDVAVSGNPAYVWFRTQCAGGTTAEEAIDVTVTLVTSDGDTELASGTLDAVRQELGPGTRLPGVLHPDETWQIVVDWTVTTSVEGNETVTFDFGFWAEQTRHVENPPTVPAGWPTCDGTGDPKHAISYVAFCTEDDATIDSLSISDDGLTLEDYSLDPDVQVDEIVIKYGNYLDVFENPSSTGTFTVGTGAADYTYHQRRGSGNGNEFLNSDDMSTERTVDRPCLTGGMAKRNV